MAIRAGYSRVKSGSGRRQVAARCYIEGDLQRSGCRHPSGRKTFVWQGLLMVLENLHMTTGETLESPGTARGD